LAAVVDAANGAASVVGPEAFRAAGASVVPLHVEPDGRNINEGSGALHPESMAKKVVETRADLASRSTATRTASSRPTGRDASWMATTCSSSHTRADPEGRKPEVVSEP